MPIYDETAGGASRVFAYDFSRMVTVSQTLNFGSSPGSSSDIVIAEELVIPTGYVFFGAVAQVTTAQGGTCTADVGLFAKDEYDEYEAVDDDILYADLDLNELDITFSSAAQAVYDEDVYVGLTLGHTTNLAAVKISLMLIDESNIRQTIRDTEVVPIRIAAERYGRCAVLPPVTIDASASNDGDGFAAADILKAINIPPDFVVLGLLLETITKQGATCTVNLGVRSHDESGTTSNSTLFATAADLNPGTVGKTLYMADANRGLTTKPSYVSVYFNHTTNAAKFKLTAIVVGLDDD